jgi:hypothetical protein
MYREGSIRAVAEGRKKYIYKLDLVGVQEVVLDGGSIEPAGEYIFFYGKWNKNLQLGRGFLVYKRISAVKRVEFFSDRIILRGRWCNIIVLNFHSPNEDKINDMKDRIYEEPEYVLDVVSKYHMNIFLRDVNAKSRQGRYFQANCWE